MAERMTQGDWNEAGFVMFWSIPNRAEYEAFNRKEHGSHEAFCKAYDAVGLDFNAPHGTPDGEVAVYHYAGRLRGESEGVVVKDGVFEPVSTERAVLEAVARSYDLEPEDVRERLVCIDHRFIEKFRWDAERSALEVVTGS